MADSKSLTILVDDLKHLALRVDQLWSEKSYEACHAEARAVLSVASRLHARLTAVLEAQKEIFGT